jgi:signal transduction histidine kinase
MEFSLSLEKNEQVREILFALIESLPSGVILADHGGQLLAVNRQGRELLGMVGVSIQNRLCWDLLKQAYSVSDDILQDLKRPFGKITCRVNQVNQTSEQRCLSFSRNELKSPFFHVNGFFLVFEDVTNQDIIKSHLERQKRVRAMRDIMMNVNQDLKNPIGSLEIFSSILHRELEGDPDNQRIVKQMGRAIKTMDYLLSNYLTFVSSPAPQLSRFLVKDWLENTLSKLQLLSHGRQSDSDYEVKITLEHNFPELMVTGDFELLNQLTFNLGLNALESMEKGGLIRIVTKLISSSMNNSNFFEVGFYDQGCGIAPSLMEKIFDPFYSSKERPNGLGLATAHHIAEVHNGLIRVESAPGKGSVFTVVLPI